MELVIRIAGAAGQGVQTLGELFSQALFRQGLFVHTEVSYHSRIRGGENAYTVRVSDKPISATGDRAHILLALNGEMLAYYQPLLVEGGFVLCDFSLTSAARAVRVPAQELARKELKLPIASGMVLLGALARFLGLDEEILRGWSPSTTGVPSPRNGSPGRFRDERESVPGRRPPGLWSGLREFFDQGGAGRRLGEA